MKKLLFILILNFLFLPWISSSSVVFDPCWLKNLADDFKIASETNQQGVFKLFYENADEVTRGKLIEGYIKLADKSNMRVDVPTVIKMGELITDQSTMLKLTNVYGSEAEVNQALKEILANMKNKCLSCTSGNTYLINSEDFIENLKFIIDKFHEVDNFVKVLNTLRTYSGIKMQDGMSHFLAVVRKFDGSTGPPSNGRTITAFEGNIAEFAADADDLSSICTGCMFDLKLSDNTLLEAKSYKGTTINGVQGIPGSGISGSTDFLSQFKTYFQSSEGKFEYWFNGLKVDDADVVKSGFKKIFEEEGFYESILDANQSNAYLLSKNIDSEESFLMAVNQIPYGPLYDFVKVI